SGWRRDVGPAASLADGRAGGLRSSREEAGLVVPAGGDVADVRTDEQLEPGATLVGHRGARREVGGDDVVQVRLADDEVVRLAEPDLLRCETLEVDLGLLERSDDTG